MCIILYALFFEQLTPINGSLAELLKKESFLHLSLEYCL